MSTGMRLAFTVSFEAFRRVPDGHEQLGQDRKNLAISPVMKS